MFVDKNRAAIFNALLVAARANDEALFELGLELDSTANIVGVLIWRLARANGIWTVFAAIDTVRIARARVHTAIVVSGTLRFARVIGATCDETSSELVKASLLTNVGQILIDAIPV